MQLGTFELERFFAPREFAAVHNLCASDCEPWTVGELLALDGRAAAAMSGLSLGYTHPGGDPRLRSSIARLYGSSITAGDVIVQSAGEEGIFAFMCGVFQPGDHVIVHYPAYQSLYEIPRALGCEVSLWTAAESQGWRLDLGALQELLRPDTRAVVVNLPHSPTGYQMPRAEWDELVAIARTRGLILFADEAYRGLEYEDDDRLSAACETYERGVSLGVLSKGYGVPGLRIGWIATRDSAIRTAVERVRDYTTICASAPSELLADIVVRNSERLLSVARDRLRRHLPPLDSFIARHRDLLDWVRPNAGPVGFPRLAGSEPVESFCDRVLGETGVLLLPGTVFGKPTRHFRIGFGRADTLEALAHLDAFLIGGQSEPDVN